MCLSVRKNALARNRQSAKKCIWLQIYYVSDPEWRVWMFRYQMAAKKLSLHNKFEIKAQII